MARKQLSVCAYIITRMGAIPKQDDCQKTKPNYLKGNL
jgi:hypothetical protein